MANLGVDPSLVALVKKLEAQLQPERATIFKGAKVVRLEGGRVTGVEYEVGGEKKTEESSVVIATG